MISQIIITASSRDQFPGRSKLDLKIRQPHVLTRNIRRAKTDRVGGDIVHHIQALPLQSAAGKGIDHSQDHAEHHRGNDHIHRHKFHSQFFNHVPPPDDIPACGRIQCECQNQWRSVFSLRIRYKPPHGFPPHQNHIPRPLTGSFP